MNTGNPDLIRFIRAEIENHGPQSFAWFMQQALYHPEHGYYSSGQCMIGRKGDYFTSVSVGPLFGQLLSAQFAEIWGCLGKPGRRGDIDKFTIVEQGAHDGQFARDVLQSVQNVRRNSSMHCAIESSSRFRFYKSGSGGVWSHFEAKLNGAHRSSHSQASIFPTNYWTRCPRV